MARWVHGCSPNCVLAGCYVNGDGAVRLFGAGAAGILGTAYLVLRRGLRGSPAGVAASPFSYFAEAQGAPILAWRSCSSVCLRAPARAFCHGGEACGARLAALQPLLRAVCTDHPRWKWKLFLLRRPPGGGLHPRSRVAWPAWPDGGTGKWRTVQWLPA